LLSRQQPALEIFIANREDDRGMDVCFFVLFSFLAVSKLFWFGAQGAASRLVFPGGSPGHQLRFEHRFLYEPMMSCLT
jgi:hypothetical protein